MIASGHKLASVQDILVEEWWQMSRAVAHEELSEKTEPWVWPYINQNLWEWDLAIRIFKLPKESDVKPDWESLL